MSHEHSEQHPDQSEASITLIGQSEARSLLGWTSLGAASHTGPKHPGNEKIMIIGQGELEGGRNHRHEVCMKPVFSYMHPQPTQAKAL